MKTFDTQKGFTLVELAIVMTIIGLLIGGILKGQELMQNARVTATVAQVKAYQAALTSFRDMYQAYPGDLTNGSTRITGCNASCDVPAATAAADGGGDSIIGAQDWSSTGAWGTQATASLGNAAGTVGTEPQLFFQEMMLAKLTGGVTTEGLSAATNYAWGVTNPSAKIGGGFIAGYDDATTFRPGWTAKLPTSSGTFIILTTSPVIGLGSTEGKQPLTALRAAQIDGKMDDGKPDTGDVNAYGSAGTAATNTGCLAEGSSTVAAVYNETVTATNCGLFFHIDG